MIKILFFASLKEQLSVGMLDYSIDNQLTVSELIDELGEKENPAWRDVLCAEDILVAVNQTIVPRDFIVNPGNEVAFFPPVTGG